MKTSLVLVPCLGMVLSLASLPGGRAFSVTRPTGVPPPRTRRSSSSSLLGQELVVLFADLPRNSFSESPSSSSSKKKKVYKNNNYKSSNNNAEDAKSLLLLQENQPNQKASQESMMTTTTAAAAAVALGLTSVAALNSDSLLPVSSISELTWHLQHLEQSLQAIVASVTATGTTSITMMSSSADAAALLSESVLAQVSQQMELLQSLLASSSVQTTTALQEWKEQLLFESSSFSATHAASLYTTAVTELETATSSLLTQIESLQLALQDQVTAQIQSLSSSSSNTDLHDALTMQWKTLAATLNDGETTLRTFHQDTVLPALQDAQTTAQATVQTAQTVAQELNFRAQFQWALWDDTVTMKWQEWQTALQQHYQTDVRAAAALQASLALKMTQWQESLIPAHWSTAQQLAANAAQATQQAVQEQLGLTEAELSSKLQVVTEQVASMTPTEVTSKLQDAVQATHQVVTEQVAMTEAEVTTKLQDFQDTVETTVAQVTVAAQQSGIEVAAQFQRQLHESMSQVDDTVVVAANALAAAKATADVSFAALEQWLPGYTATVHAILTERAAALTTLLGTAADAGAATDSWTQLLQQQQALVLELLFQLKSTMHAKLDAILLAGKDSIDTTDEVLIQQMAAANAQLKILQDSLLTTHHNAAAGVYSNHKTQQALEFLTSSTQEKLVAVSTLLPLAVVDVPDTAAFGPPSNVAHY